MKLGSLATAGLVTGRLTDSRLHKPSVQAEVSDQPLIIDAYNEGNSITSLGAAVYERLPGNRPSSFGKKLDGRDPYRFTGAAIHGEADGD